MREITVHELDQVAGGITGIEIAVAGAIAAAGLAVGTAIMIVYDNRAMIVEWWDSLSWYEQGLYGALPGFNAGIAFAQFTQWMFPQCPCPC